jgi:hypothetical protein
MTKTQLIEDIRRDVPFERLLAAMFVVWSRQKEGVVQSFINELDVSAGELTPERVLDEFLQDNTVEHLKLLRKLALELEDDVEQ